MEAFAKKNGKPYLVGEYALTAPYMTMPTQTTAH
jgi:hypothetical protein